MSSGIIAVIIVVAIIVIALVIAATMAARRRRLQQQFGEEYDRALADKDTRRSAEAELTERQRRVRKYDIRPLSPESRSRYLGEWQAIQEQFVDSPQAAVAEAYTLVTTVMQERGYPPVEDDQVADDLSVEHADTVGHFRSAQAISREAAHGSVATEDLRQAFIHYRELFADLLGDADDGRGLNGTAPVAAAAAETSAPAGRHAAPQADLDDPVDSDFTAEPVHSDFTAEPVDSDFTAEPEAPVATDPDGQPVTAPDLGSRTPRRQ